MVNALISICSKQKLQIQQGNKVVEIKSPDCNKDSEVSRLLSNAHYDFVMPMGDDTTDDDMFQPLFQNAIAIKIGSVSEMAGYNLPSQTDVLPFLQSIVIGNFAPSKNGKVTDYSMPSTR